MVLRSVDFHPEAIVEAREAGEWYAANAGRVALIKFNKELDRAVERISESPSRWPEHHKGTRRYLLRRFPFAVIYRVFDSSIQVVAIAHAKRRPGYWKNR